MATFQSEWRLIEASQLSVRDVQPGALEDLRRPSMGRLDLRERWLDRQRFPS
jgi:hypothetical protein